MELNSWLQGKNKKEAMNDHTNQLIYMHSVHEDPNGPLVDCPNDSALQKMVICLMAELGHQGNWPLQ